MTCPFGHDPGVDVLAKLGLVDYSIRDFKTLAAAFHCYHNCKAALAATGNFPSESEARAHARSAWALVALSGGAAFNLNDLA